MQSGRTTTMLGSEYNWLISHSQPTDGAPQVRMASTGMLTLAVAVFCLCCVAVHAEPPHRVLLREALAAAKAGDNAKSLAKLEAVRALRPDYPRALYNLACGYAAAGRTDDAFAQLRELAAMGLAFNIAQDQALASLRGQPGFATLAAAFSANLSANGHDDAAWAITDADGIIEGLACHPATLEWYFSDVRNRCVWHRDVNTGTGLLKKFSSDADNLLGVFGLQLDVARNTLWAATSAVPEMKGYTETDKGRAALVAFDLTTGRVRHSFPVPTDGLEHVLGDMVLAPEGSVFLSDSTAPVIWRLTPGGKALEKWLESADFVSLQGLTLSTDGKTLFVADYANGLWRINLSTRATELVPAPAHSTLFGIDGLYAVSGGLIAVQNGLNPQRVIRIGLSGAGHAESVKVLLSGHAAMNDPTLGQIVNGRFHFIGNSGWPLFENPKAAPAARNVTILSTRID